MEQTKHFGPTVNGSIVGRVSDDEPQTRRISGDAFINPNMYKNPFERLDPVQPWKIGDQVSNPWVIKNNDYPGVKNTEENEQAIKEVMDKLKKIWNEMFETTLTNFPQLGYSHAIKIASDAVEQVIKHAVNR